MQNSGKRSARGEGSRASPFLSNLCLESCDRPGSAAGLRFLSFCGALRVSHRAPTWQNERLEGCSDWNSRLCRQDSCCLPNGFQPLLLNAKSTLGQ